MEIEYEVEILARINIYRISTEIQVLPTFFFGFIHKL